MSRPRSHLSIDSQADVGIRGYRSIAGRWGGGVLIGLAFQAVGHDEEETHKEEGLIRILSEVSAMPPKK